MRRLATYLGSAGWPANHVCAVEFRDRYGSNVEHAAEIAEAVAGLADRTGSERVDLVAHSMGGLAARHALARPAVGSLVRRLICLGTPHQGTLAAWLAWGGGSREMRIGSGFLASLPNAPPDGVDVVTISTPFDFRIFPGSSACWGSRHYRVSCFGHRRLVRSRAVLQLVAELLQSSEVTGMNTPNPSGSHAG